MFIVVFILCLHKYFEKQNLGIHPQQISDSFGRAAVRGVEVLKEMSKPVQLTDGEQMIKIASTSLNSKVFYMLLSDIPVRFFLVVSNVVVYL